MLPTLAKAGTIAVITVVFCTGLLALDASTDCVLPRPDVKIGPVHLIEACERPTG